MQEETFYIPIQGLALKIHTEKKAGLIVHIHLAIAHRPKILSSSLAQKFCELLEGKRDRSSISFEARGTPFQKKVWDATCKIPFGGLASYSEVASEIGCGSAIAVGQALKSNPLPIIIPCHRVIGKNGDLVGFSSGLKIKKLLLEFEKTIILA
ncbi:MAG: methylated-DNA--[protein]-cysteine S-methyltransferase [Nitrospiraceae bacterium]|nr:methylated-DNA--[protein]-cysteine S-methyltransferase [Nitrospiraceae bacterium]